jgi:hypothetical protein
MSDIKDKIEDDEAQKDSYMDYVMTNEDEEWLWLFVSLLRARA